MTLLHSAVSYFGLWPSKGSLTREEEVLHGIGLPQKAVLRPPHAVQTQHGRRALEAVGEGVHVVLDTAVGGGVSRQLPVLALRVSALH